MSDDIVKRLRYGLIDTNTSYRYQQEAADEIEKLRAALKPFADIAESLPHRSNTVTASVLMSDLRAAKAALGE